MKPAVQNFHKTVRSHFNDPVMAWININAYTRCKILCGQWYYLLDSGESDQNISSKLEYWARPKVELNIHVET